MPGMNELLAVSFLFLAVSATGCGSSTNVSVFSCSYAVGNIQMCAEYTDIDAAEMTDATATCTSERGTAVLSCPSTNSLGTCTVTSDGIAFSLTFYSNGGVTTAEAQMSCATQSGSWNGAE